MKRIVLSITTLAFVGALVAGGTYAVWSDSKTIEGNTISGGVVSLELVNGSATQRIEKPIDTAENLFPGEWSDWHHKGLKNKSTAPTKLYMYVTNVEGDGGICDNTNLEIEVHGDSDETSEEKWEFYDGPLLDLKGKDNRKDLTADLDDIDDSGESIFYPTLEENWVLVVHQRAGLDDEAPDSAQGEACTWDEVFVMESHPEGSDD